MPDRQEEPAAPDSGSSLRERATAALMKPGKGAMAIAFLLFALLATMPAYWALFSYFAPYDDEGTMLVTLLAFLDGRDLYSQVFTIYGPVYYQFFGFIFGLFGIEVTNNASRIAVVLIWIATSVTFGLTALRISRSLALGIVAACLASAQLFLLTYEPMHPTGLCLLVIALSSLAMVALPDRRALTMGLLVGVGVAVLVLIKVNIGFFALSAVALAAVSVYPTLRGRLWIRLPVTILFVAQPLLVVSSSVSDGAWREMVAWATLGMAAVAVAAWRLAPGDGHEPSPGQDPVRRWLIGLVGGGVGLTFVSLLVAMVMGASPGTVYDGIITQALELDTVFQLPLVLPDPAIMLALLGLFGAFRLGRSPRESGGIAPGLLRIGAGLLIWLSLAASGTDWANPLGFHPLALPMVLAWLAVLPPDGLEQSGLKLAARAFLAALAVAEVLQIYPIAGTQALAATLSFIPLGAICISDGWSVLRRELRGRPVVLDRVRHGTAAALSLLAVFALWTLVIQPGLDNRDRYLAGERLPIEGASRLSLPPEEVEKYTGMVEALDTQRCTALIGYPGLNSLYLWSDIELPDPTLPGAWYQMLSDSEQNQIVEQVRSATVPCAFRNDSAADFWLRGKPQPEGPAVNLLNEDFTPLTDIYGWTFMVLEN
jgi:hypothetical protein